MNTQAPAMFPPVAAVLPTGCRAALGRVWDAWRMRRLQQDVPVELLRREGLLPPETPDPRDIANKWLGGRLPR